MIGLRARINKSNFTVQKKCEMRNRIHMSLAESIDMRAKGRAVKVLSNPVRMYGNEDPRTSWA